MNEFKRPEAWQGFVCTLFLPCQEIPFHGVSVPEGVGQIWSNQKEKLEVGSSRKRLRLTRCSRKSAVSHAIRGRCVVSPPLYSL